MGIIPETAAEGPGRRPIPASLRLLVCRRIREGGWPVWKATRYYHVKRQSVHRWLSRYDGTSESLASRSRRPKRSPRSMPREAARLGASHKRIRPGTPRHNGKVERSHRIDQEKFYRTLRGTIRPRRRRLASGPRTKPSLMGCQGCCMIQARRGALGVHMS